MWRISISTLIIKILFESGKRYIFAHALSGIKINDNKFNIKYNNNKVKSEFIVPDLTQKIMKNITMTKLVRI